MRAPKVSYTHDRMVVQPWITCTGFCRPNAAGYGCSGTAWQHRHKHVHLATEALSSFCETWYPCLINLLPLHRQLKLESPHCLCGRCSCGHCCCCHSLSNVGSKIAVLPDVWLNACAWLRRMLLCMLAAAARDDVPPTCGCLAETTAPCNQRFRQHNTTTGQLN